MVQNGDGNHKNSWRRRGSSILGGTGTVRALAKKVQYCAADSWEHLTAAEVLFSAFVAVSRQNLNLVCGA